MAAKNRMGLTILYDPAKPPSKTSPNVDLVLVHGLNGGHIKTWTCTTGGSDVVWPRDLLPGVQRRTRVLSFGYSGDIYENPTTSGIRDIARSLLSSLKLRRHSDKTRPIVFLAHCLGGLIVKQALRFANNEDEYYSIAKATHSVMFFGTPHFGADEKKWLSIANAFTPLANNMKDRDNSEPSILVDMITRKARDLAEISEDFCQRSSHYKLKTFFEELPFPGTNKVIVDKMDAHMFLDNEVPKGVHANHLSMVQFEDEDDETFLHVCQYISEAVVVEEEVPPPPYTSTAPLPHPQPYEPLEEWATREKMFRELERAMAGVRLDDKRRTVHISPSSARRPVITTPPPRRHPTTPLLLLDTPTQRPTIPWESEKRGEKLAIPVGIWEPEEESDMEVEEIVLDAPVCHPLGVDMQDEGETTIPWATDACVSDEEIEDDDDEFTKGDQVAHSIKLDKKKASVNVTVVAVDGPGSGDEGIPAQPPQDSISTEKKIPIVTARAVSDSEVEDDKGVLHVGGEHGKISGFLSRVWSSWGSV